MKKAALIIVLLIAIHVSYGQNNTFPDPGPGNAGIGTTAPTHSLTIASTGTGFAHYNTTDQTSAYSRFVGSWSGTTYSLGTYYNTGATLGTFRIGVSSTPLGASLTKYLQIANSGTMFNFVSNTIGSAGNTINLGSITYNAATGTQASLGLNPTINQSGTASYNALYISPYEQATGSGSKYLINAGTNTAGNNGGIHTPLFTVDDQGAGAFALKLGVGISYPNSIIQAKSFWGNCDLLLETLGGVKWDLSSNEDGSFTFYRPTTNAYPVVITNSGNFLIGKTSQANTLYKLDVGGDVRANKIVVNTTGADFVFEPHYHLIPLNQLEQFVKQYHHLPGIETANTMQKDGVDVGENQTKLLQKIEELTLYIIELKKEVDELKKNKTN